MTGCSGTTGLPDLGELASLAQSSLSSTGALDEQTVVAGLKEALEVGTQRTVDSTSKLNGYLKNDLIRIPLPESLQPMAKGLRTIGFSKQVDDLEVAMNRAAERAAGEAADVFWDAISQMSFADAWSILQGDDTAATDYFRRTTSEPLRARFSPIVSEKMDQVGLVSMYDQLAAQYAALPFKKKPPTDVRAYVTDQALDGLFTVLGQEEQRIRQDPVARSSELLQRVFGSARASR